jgi:hypothetical protein
MLPPTVPHHLVSRPWRCVASHARTAANPYGRISWWYRAMAETGSSPVAQQAAEEVGIAASTIARAPADGWHAVNSRPKRSSAFEDVPDDQRSAHEAGADRDPLGDRLDPALGLRSEPRMLWCDSSEPDGEPDRRRHNDYHQD